MGERGFTLLEVLVGMAIMSIVAGAATIALTTTIGSANIAHQQMARFTGVDGTTDALVEDAGSAAAIGQDGAGGCSTAPASQVVFVSGNPGSTTVHSVTYAQAGSTVTRSDSATGQTATIPGLIGLSATCTTGDKLSNLPELSGIVTTDARMRPLPQSQALGGTSVVNVTLQTSSLQRDVHLVAAVAPSGFTVNGRMKWHAVLWRVDQTHRFWFGLAQKSHTWIYGSVYITYNNWSTSQLWCTQQLYHDSNDQYDPNNPAEKAMALYAHCKATAPLPPPDGSSNPFSAPPMIQDCTLINGTVVQGTCPPQAGYVPPAAHVPQPRRSSKPCTQHGNTNGGGTPNALSSRRTSNANLVALCDNSDNTTDPSASPQPAASTSPSPVPTGGAECYDYIVAQAAANGQDAGASFDGYTNGVSVNGTAATLPTQPSAYHWIDPAGTSVDGLSYANGSFTQQEPVPANSAIAVDMDNHSPRLIANFIPVAIVATDANGNVTGAPIGYVCVPER